jgi:hypothetical protein
MSKRFRAAFFQKAAALPDLHALAERAQGADL